MAATKYTKFRDFHHKFYICGENIGAISHLLEFYKTAKRLSKDRPSGELNIGYEHIIKRKTPAPNTIMSFLM